MNLLPNTLICLASDTLLLSSMYLIRFRVKTAIGNDLDLQGLPQTGEVGVSYCNSIP
jgi:hypothetical protein